VSDYVLGTHDEELQRLGLQHRVWRSRALDAWRRAGFTVGHTLLDIGCGPGYASKDLAEIVGAEGKVIAIDRSERYLEALRRAAIENVETRLLDLDRDDLPAAGAHGVWARWVFAFLERPADLVKRIAAVLQPGGRLVIHEYFDYGAWRLAPRSAIFEESVATVTKSWRASGGEPDIALDLPSWLEDSGFSVTSWQPFIDVITRHDFMWQWPKTFIEVGLRRLVELGAITERYAGIVRNDFVACEAAPHTRMITPGVLEIIAVRT
jgi:SAM-dependent methyltransferase